MLFTPQPSDRGIEPHISQGHVSLQDTTIQEADTRVTFKNGLTELALQSTKMKMLNLNWNIILFVKFYFDLFQIPLVLVFSAIDPYVKILCEGEKVISEKLMKTNSPQWNIKATFYRKKPDTEPITVEVNRLSTVPTFCCFS